MAESAEDLKAKVLLFRTREDVVTRPYYRCPTSGRALIGLLGDDKVWCAACGVSHKPQELMPSSLTEMDRQIAELRRSRG